MLIYSIPPLPSLRPWSTQASAFAGMSSDSESSDGEAPAPVKVEAAPSKVWIDVHRVLPSPLPFVRDTICSRGHILRDTPPDGFAERLALGTFTFVRRGA